MTWADVVAFAEAHQPGARAIECPRCKAAPYAACALGEGLITPNGEMHRDRVEASAGKPWPTLRTPEQTRGYIADRTEARRLIQALTEAADRDPRLVIDQLAAIRNCPHAIAAMGRVLASGERKHGATGPSANQTAQDHAERAMSHAAVAFSRPEERDDETGELHATHAACRWALFREVSR